MSTKNIAVLKPLHSKKTDGGCRPSYLSDFWYGTNITVGFLDVWIVYLKVPGILNQCFYTLKHSAPNMSTLQTDYFQYDFPPLTRFGQNIPSQGFRFAS